ncbi:LCP family protein [Streptomyces sp. ISL-10]|uniref:LCP family protein n=1 Tax=Streptomyces sp. ISL-10 TaxID=2819172 RepID=UPI001BE99812|nr:LCP family protein [Streptomyces sp. ISL-10]MBT2368314.1 LCP family protein [Streptomyces sp. ISL-10]
MNDQQHSYDPYRQQPQIVGYDEYGQPVYQQPQPYDPYAQQQPQHPQQPYPQQPAGQQPGQQPQAGQDYGYDPYAQQGSDTSGRQEQYGQYDPYATQQQHPQSGGQGYGYEGYSYDTGTQPAAVDTTQQWNIPHQQPVPAERQTQAQGHDQARAQAQVAPGPAAVPEQRRGADDRDYRTEQFSFIEEPDEDSEDVIDWLKFTESRSERREEAKRRGRNRVVALVVTLALVLVGGVGYLWYAGKLPGLSDAKSTGGTAVGPQKRDVIVVHLHNTKSERTSTALLVDNVTTGQGTTVLLPNTLSVANDDGTATTLGKSVEDDGSTGTRESIGTLLGAKISGTWRLDTPYLENLVELVGTIDLTTDAEVPGAKKGDESLVKKGENQTLDGRAAVAYATYVGPGEAEEKQLQRFGQVMQGVLKKLPDDPRSATVVIETLAQILDPSLNEKDLGTSLASLAEHAKGGDYRTALLPVQQDGTLTEQAANSVVKDVLGGSVSAPEQGAAVRVGIKNASGDDKATETARISLVNGGYTVIDSGRADTVATSRITYGDEAQKAKAVEVAKTLDLSPDVVKKGKGAANADVSVVLGSDFKAGDTTD